MSTLTSKDQLDPAICGDDGPITPDQCALWLDAKYRRHGELEDRAAAMWLRKLSARPAHETTALPESLRDPAVVMERVRTLHQQTDAALWLLRWLSRKGGLGHDVHKLIDAVLEGRAYVRNDQLHTDGPHAQKAIPQRVAYNSNGDAYLVEPPPSSEPE